MYLLEKYLEEIIFNNDSKTLESKGLALKGKKLRQVKIGNYGIADLITIKTRFEGYKFHVVEITVIELKKDCAGISAFFQAIRYVTGIKRYCDKKYPFIKFEFNIILIGSSIDKSGSLCFVPNLIYNEVVSEESISGNICSICFYEYKYDLNGVTFNIENYDRLINEGF